MATWYGHMGWVTWDESHEMGHMRWSHGMGHMGHSHGMGQIGFFMVLIFILLCYIKYKIVVMLFKISKRTNDCFLTLAETSRHPGPNSPYILHPVGGYILRGPIFHDCFLANFLYQI